MGILKEFKEFAVKGNVMDLAIAVVIGAAFGKIVTSLVNDLNMPPLGLLLGNRDFSNLRVILQDAKLAVTEGDQIIVPAVAEVSIRYGAFINTVLDFLIVAGAIFLVIKGFNSLKRKKEEAPAAPPALPREEVLLTEIRDILKNKSTF